MAQWAKVPAAKANNLNSNPGTHLIEREGYLPKVVL